MKAKVNTAEVKKQAAALRAKFEKYGKQVKDEVGKAVLKSCIKVKTDAKMNTPVLTGLLRASFSEKIVNTAMGVDGYVGTNVTYAIPVERGTSKRKGRFMLTNSFNANLSRVRAWIKAGIQAAKKGVAK
jgi:HK97 gp10 family phage protein